MRFPIDADTYDRTETECVSEFSALTFQIAHHFIIGPSATSPGHLGVF
jgi:hypothetical protein